MQERLPRIDASIVALDTSQIKSLGLLDHAAGLVRGTRNLAERAAEFGGSCRPGEISDIESELHRWRISANSMKKAF
jgi:hypothetical protein